MAFPSSPSNGQTVTVNGVTYTYYSATNSWKRSQTPITSPIAANVIYANLFAYQSNSVSILSDVNSSIAAANSSITAANLSIVTANTAMKAYVDSANLALKSYADTQISSVITEWTSNAATQASQIAGANAAIITANTALKSYTDDQVTLVTTAWTSNAATQASQIAGANAAIITANSALKAYADDQITTANAALKAYTDNQITTANTALKAYVDSANTIQSNQINALVASAYTNANVNAYLTSTGAGNISISSGAFSLVPTGPGAVNVGSSTSIPTIVTDAYGRVVSLTSNAVSTTIDTVGTTGTGSISGGGTLTFTSTNGFVVAASGSTISLSSPQNIQVSASPTFAGITTTGASQVNSTLGVTGVTSITNSTTSTGAGNGALIVTGGAGIGGVSYFGNDVHIVGNLYVPNVIATTSSVLNTSSPMVHFDVSPVYPYNFDVGFHSHFVGGPANVLATTGFVRNHNNNRWVFFSNVGTEPSSTTIDFADPGILYDTVHAGALLLSNVTHSTSVTNGALVVAGGAGIDGNLNVNSAGYFGYNAANTPLTNPSIVGTSSSQAVDAGQYYVQSALINTNATGSSDIVAYPNNTTDGITGFMDMGFTGNLFSDPAYTITKANDGYLFASAREGSVLGGNLVLATDRTGTYNDIVFATGSFFANAEVARFSGNATTNGYFQITTGTSASSTSTGALRVTGGMGVTGSVYAGSLYDNGTRVVSTSSGSGNLSISNGAVTLPVTGPGATTVGGATAIPVITTDAYGRVTALSTASVSSTLNIAGGTGTGSVALTSQSLTIAAGTGISTSASGQTITVTNSGVTGVSSSGAGNLTVSASTGAITVSLPATGPGATTVGSSTTIPVITTDAYGRIVGLTTSSITAGGSFNLAGTSGTGSITSGGTLTFAGSNGFTATVSGSTITLSSAQNLQTTASPTFAGLNLNGGISATTGTFTGATTRNSKAIITNYTGTSAPSSPQQGDEWYNSSTGVLYKYIYDGTSYVWVNISSSLSNSSTSATANTLALRDGSANLYAANFMGTASSAKYADLAEVYSSDKQYEPGTVVVFGGTKEITTSKKTHDTRVAGVISTNPAYLMNSEADGLPVAFTGRVPCKVRGPIEKGDVLVTSAHEGYAERMFGELYTPGCILGKALGTAKENEFTTIEVVVGRF